MKSKYLAIPMIAALIAFALPAHAADDAFKKEYSEIKTEWAKAKYEVKGKEEKLFALEKLEVRAGEFALKYRDKAEPKLILATIMSTQANIIHGLSALPKVKVAKSILEESIAIDPKAANGNAHAILGALYAEVPGWPIAFGDKQEAKKHLDAALAIAPDDIDNNYFYGTYLLSEKKYDDAKKYLEKALNAKPRAGEAVADAGRKAEAKDALEKLKKASSQPQRQQYN